MSSPAARLIGAASDGDKKVITQLLKDGTDVNVRDWDDLTALIPASSSGHLEVVKLLQSKGADVNAHDKDGITALMEASIMGHPKVVEFLLDKGAEVDATAKSGVTALWLAAGEGKTDVMQVLLKKGADASNTRVDGISALMSAAVSGHADAIDILLKNGADPTASDGDGLTPLMNAAEKGSKECLKSLVDGIKPEDKAQYINAFSSTGFNALIIASAHGHGDAVEYLINAGAVVDAAFDSKVTALMYAAASNHLDVLKHLVKAGADVSLTHTNGGTALLEASTGGAPEALSFLIESGADFDFMDDDGVTPLMAVASQGNVDSQKLILEKLQAKLSKDDVLEHINRFSHSGGSSVMFAAAGGHLECAKQLVGLGADINAIARATPGYLEKLKEMIAEGQVDPEEDPHVDGVTALHVAAQGGHLDTVKYLLELGASVAVEDDEKRTALTLAIKGNHGETASTLVEAGADPNTKYVDEEGTTHNLLMDAIIVENVDFAKLLIEKGADLYYTDERSVSTLLQSSHRGLTEVVELLLSKHDPKKNSVYIDQPSDDGVSPFIAAGSEGHTDIVKLLIKAGASVNGVDKDGTTAIMAASARGHKEAVQAMLEAGADVNMQNDDGHTALMFGYNGKNQVETLWERYAQYMGDGEEDDGGTGPIIREAVDLHVALVDILLKAGANPNIKDKEGQTAKDFDYNPDADAEVLTKAEKMANMASSKEEL
uniref:Uncharacterized protein n=1 Tax=Grammatophora oceanica TaxID=210454 RepID=A0A7S1ULV4_9STRA